MKKKLLIKILFKRLYITILLFITITGCISDQKKRSQIDTKKIESTEEKIKLFDSLQSNWITKIENGKTVEYELISKDGKSISNQVIRFNGKGKIDTVNSRFFKLKIEDTLSLGKNVGVINSFTFNQDYENIYSYVIIENQYSDSEIRLDTFGNNEKNVTFGIFANQPGTQTIKGELFEQYLLPEEIITKDSVTIDLMEIHSYFEKEVYIKDTIESNR